MSHRIRIAAAVAALALGTTALAGCSLIPDPVRDIVDQAQSLTTMPEDWPAEVPVVDGDVLVALKPTDGSWGATIRVADEAAAQESVTLLEDAGFEAIVEGATAFENDSYHVAVSWAETEGGVGVAYIVTAK